MLRLDVQIAIVARVPLVLLLGLDLLLDQFDEERGQRVVVEMAQQPRENFALLVQEQILQRHLFLLVEQLLHHFEEAAAKDRQRVLIFVQELAQ